MILTDTDKAQLYEIEKLCFNSEWSEQTLFAEAENPLCELSLCRRDGIIAGFALGRVAADEGELFQIGVSPQYRRQGIAAELLKALHARLRERGAVCCFLEVRSRNAGAIALYERMGYAQISVRRGYYGDDDALIYRCELQEV